MSIHVELVTPEKLAWSDDVDFIAAPASDGEIGILPHHAPLLTRLGHGELRFQKGNILEHFAISGGFLEVHPGSHVSIFAEAAELAKDIDEERARMAADRAKEKLSTPTDLTAKELAELEAALSRALLRIKIAGSWKKRPHHLDPSHH